MTPEPYPTLPSSSSTVEASSRAVTRWLEEKIRSSMRQSVATLAAQLRAEQEERERLRR
ncbi:hypothetical protein [Streptomyces sp. 2A115]|uniref:hypothetical protein n=1 Tax=Streptomyces sp. 2A115 TaxID=3457439 RepID=UPI003FD5BFD3